ncbi:Amino acid/polyamine transporter I [Cordyceps fumosorosea ARSEF 2679]|uniref:Amino acid/polyamine transporter I n=1 Tax=Cordyceps fumosorosea (strain ARSEF 2679) TaxID=1081104 RepID=A0A167BDU2_CORFA|nr:Amino acid/polyamine transporter I [Cordyceps fumosorosea ARSEF 2679]OAA39932.1 Amino acid/polyamine transporter I [Cordyceps fumosorosea ARSEF 2679]
MSSTGHELGNMATATAKGMRAVEAPSSPHSEDVVSKSDYADSEQLARLGKKSVLKRNFGFMSILGFSCTILITWEATLVLSAQGLANGGYAGVLYGYIIVWLGNISVFTTLSELASMAPTSGGQYHWVAMLAPRRCSKFLSYITGWLAVGGWQGSVASSAFLTGTMIQGMVAMNNPETYAPQAWQGTLLFWAVMLFAVLVNAVVSSALPKFEGLILILHVLGFFAILIPMVSLGYHGDPHQVFTEFRNGGGWPTQGLSFMVGLVGNVFAFVGVDAAFHMSEETLNSAVTVPKSIFLSMLINGTTGFAMTVAVLFCIQDLDRVLSSPTGFAHMQLFLDSTGSVAGSTAMAAVITALGACATVGMLASTSRVFWSFARDRGLPFWRVLSRVDARTTVPLWAVACTTAIACLLALINLGSATALNAVISLSISCLYLSYFICAALLLYRRTTSGFVMPGAAEMPALANTTGAELVWGPWHLPGALGIVNNAISCVYLIVIFFFSFWPGMMDPTAANMNWAAAVTGFILIFSILYYVFWARKEYEGPIVEI